MRSRPSFYRETVHVLGGGPSLKLLDPASLGADPVIAVNNAGLDFFPDADILLVMDKRWFEWNYDRLDQNFSAERYVRRSQLPTRFAPPWPMIPFDHDPELVSGTSPDRLAGCCGGGAALNLAVVLGASRVVLHGFDMRPGNYHDAHKSPTAAHLYETAFIPAIERMAAAFPPWVDIYNATPGSALKCFMSIPWI